MAHRLNLFLVSCFGDTYKSAEVDINKRRYKGHSNKINESKKDVCALIVYLLILQKEFYSTHFVPIPIFLIAYLSSD